MTNHDIFTPGLLDMPEPWREIAIASPAAAAEECEKRYGNPIPAADRRQFMRGWCAAIMVIDDIQSQLIALNLEATDAE